MYILSKDIERKRKSDIHSVTKMTGNNPHLDLVNISTYAIFNKILSICSKDIERIPISDINQGP